MFLSESLPDATSLPNARSHRLGGTLGLLDGSPVEAPPQVPPAGPELGRGRWPRPGTPRGQRGRTPHGGRLGVTRTWVPGPAGRVGAGAASVLDLWTVGVRMGWPPQQALAVRVGLFLPLAFTILFFLAQVRTA